MRDRWQHFRDHIRQQHRPVRVDFDQAQKPQFLGETGGTPPGMHRRILTPGPVACHATISAVERVTHDATILGLERHQRLPLFFCQAVERGLESGLIQQH